MVLNSQHTDNCCVKIFFKSEMGVFGNLKLCTIDLWCFYTLFNEAPVLDFESCGYKNGMGGTSWVKLDLEYQNF